MNRFFRYEKISSHLETTSSLTLPSLLPYFFPSSLPPYPVKVRHISSMVRVRVFAFYMTSINTIDISDAILNLY